LALVQDLLLSNIIISSECQVVVGEIAQGTWGYYATVIKEIQASLSEFVACNFIFENRSLNVEADSLAKFSLHLALGRHVWLL
jgi:hypothetical protein